ncbi:MAG TPA: hypothetical protein VKY92_19330 [Verrucomicrobiae bacterium]|nr:hypothetical protein [Verrucomicrobiae bacterium]
MNSDTRNPARLTQSERRAGFQLGAIVVCSSAFVTGAGAQSVLAPPPAEFSAPSATPQVLDTNQPAAIVMNAAAPPPASAPEKPWLQFGPVQVHPHLLYRFMYGDGLQAAPGQQSKTVIEQVYPGVLFRVGNHWSLDYTPTLSFYSSKNFKDTVDQAVNLTGGTVYQDWSFGLSQGYSSSSQPLVETGAQTDQQNYNTVLNASYQMNGDLSLQMSANQNFTFVDQSSVAGQPLNNSRTWSTMEWLNDQVGPRVGLALGAGFGYDNVSTGANMTHENVQGRVSGRLTGKISLVFSAGFEDRQFLNSNASDSINPIFSGSAIYLPFQNTTLSLSAARTVSPSLFQNQISTSTTVTAGLRQRLLGKLFLDLSGGYFASSYGATESNLNVSRQDTGTFVNARIGTQFLKRGTAAVFYQHSENSSSQGGFGFTSSQVGFELGYRL